MEAGDAGSPYHSDWMLANESSEEALDEFRNRRQCLEDLDVVLESIRAPRFLDFSQMLRDDQESNPADLNDQAAANSVLEPVCACLRLMRKLLDFFTPLSRANSVLLCQGGRQDGLSDDDEFGEGGSSFNNAHAHGHEAHVPTLAPFPTRLLHLF